jgi:hypothetical protein
MKRISAILVVGIVLVGVVLTPSAFAGKRWHVRTPGGARVQLLVTDSALKNVRIYDLAFSENGDTFSITAAPLGPSDSSISFTISFYDGEYSVQDDSVYVGPGKTTQEVHCPETFDRMVLDYSGY